MRLARVGVRVRVRVRDEVRLARVRVRVRVRVRGEVCLLLLPPLSPAPPLLLPSPTFSRLNMVFELALP